MPEPAPDHQPTAAERATRRAAFAARFTRPEERLDPRERAAARLLSEVHPGALARARRRRRSA